MTSDSKFQRRFIISVFIFFYLMVVLRNAWVCDDAYISFRVVDNFVNGFGLRWNIAERVQAFTNPLWVLVLTPVYALTREIFFTSIIVSLFLVVGTVIISAYRISKSLIAGCFGIITLALSDAFVDFSTSGLENPLTFLLLSIFLWIFFGQEKDNAKIVKLSFVGSLLAVNRLDNLIFCLPPLIYSFWQVRSWQSVRLMLLGFLPLIFWELFSLIYFGFPFSNTAYAKLNLGFNDIRMIKMGFSYILNSIEIDPLTILVISTAIVISLLTRSKKSIVLSISLIVYILYIIRIGGCFMTGRFFAAPFLIGTLSLMHLWKNMSLKFILCAAVPIIILGFISERSPIYAKASDSEAIFMLRNGITDERAYYNPTNGLMTYDRHAPMWPNHAWSHRGKTMREENTRFHVTGAVGMMGYFGGPNLYILDVHALTDPILSRLPLITNVKYKIGHYRRVLPPGLLKTLETDTNYIAHPDLAKYYDKIRLITRGEIFSARRFIEIFKINLGFYDNLVDNYINQKTVEVAYDLISQPTAEGADWLEYHNIVFEYNLQINFDSTIHLSRFEINRDHNDDYRANFIKSTEELGSVDIPRHTNEAGGLVKDIFDIPSDITIKGFDKIRFEPVAGDRHYSIGHVILLE